MDIENEMNLIKEAMRLKSKTSDDRGVIGENTVNNALVEELMLPEDHKIGSVDPKVFLKFVRLNGGFFKWGVVTIVLIAAITTCKTMASIVIQHWC